eukprot:TRINITY_DN33788_c0_g1_i5.p1 TRINITY_DN33788_c0_g1~~TRINITY_DN33788_c0_g1_i5.p1  ORF type:complete len:435 (+),score=71.23 TRINITY_DN33788_c0_g1_i5:249-1553(+)
MAPKRFAGNGAGDLSEALLDWLQADVAGAEPTPKGGKGKARKSEARKGKGKRSDASSGPSPVPAGPSAVAAGQSRAGKPPPTAAKGKAKSGGKASRKDAASTPDASMKSEAAVSPPAATEAAVAAADKDEEEEEEDFLSRYDTRPVYGIRSWSHGRCLRTGRRVAIKTRNSLSDVGISQRYIREITALKDCKHPNVVELLDLNVSPSGIVLVFELVDMNLEDHLKRHGALKPEGELQRAASDCFAGIEYLHSTRLLHRHLKPRHILVQQPAKRMVLTGFSFARYYGLPERTYTREVGTLWYRAPELMLVDGSQATYGPPVDVWAMGCILLEMATRRAVFDDSCEIGVLFKIFQVLGTPTEAEWPGITKLPLFKQRTFPKWTASRLDRLDRFLGEHREAGQDLVIACLRYDCKERLSARAALQHPFLRLEGASSD